MDGRVDSENATQFVAAYQTVAPLKMGELWAFPIMLQLALVENLRRVGLRIARRREDLNAAITWADRMLATAEREPKQLIQLLAEFANADVPLTAPFVEEFYARLQAQGPAMAFVQTWVEHNLLEQGVTATQLSEAASRIGRRQSDFHRKLHRQSAVYRRNGLAGLFRVAQCRRTDIA